MVAVCFAVGVSFGSGLGCQKPGETMSAATKVQSGPAEMSAAEPTQVVGSATAFVDGPAATTSRSDVISHRNESNADPSGELAPSAETGSSSDTSKRSESNAGKSTDGQPLPDLKVRPRSKVRAGGLLDLTFDDVEFGIEKDAPFDRSMLTPEIEAMDGREVIIRGFILESYQMRNIREFVLVRDNQECCFGPGAYIYHNMQVEMVGDARAEYSIRPVSVRGKFTIKPWIGPDGKCYSVFHIAATSFTK